MLVRRDLLVIIFSGSQSPHSNYNTTNRLPKGLENPERFVDFRKNEAKPSRFLKKNERP